MTTEGCTVGTLIYEPYQPNRIRKPEQLQPRREPIVVRTARRSIRGVIKHR